jgi:hypothetical protein
MFMRQFSISNMMGFVVTCALGLAAVRNANDFWAGLMPLLVAFFLGLAALNVIHLRGAGRAWWAGFLVFAGGYHLLSSSSLGTSSRSGPTLATTQLLAYVHARVGPIGRPDVKSLNGLYQKRSEAKKLADLEEKGEAKKLADLEEKLHLSKIEAKKLADLDERMLGLEPLPSSLTKARSVVSSIDAEIVKSLKPVTTPPNHWRDLIPGASNYEQFLIIGHGLFGLLVGLVGAIISSRLQTRCQRQSAHE